MLSVWTLAACLTACGSRGDNTAHINVEVTVDVCSGGTCFAAPVPDASVTVDGGAGDPMESRTDAEGSAEITLPGTDTYTVDATWADKSGRSSQVAVGSDDVDVSIRLLPAVDARLD